MSSPQREIRDAVTRTLPKLKSRRLTLSLRQQVALVIALLSFLPNLLVAGPLILSAYSRLGGLSRELWPPILGWMLLIAVLSSAIGYLLSGHLLAPLTRLTEQLHTLGRTSETLSHARLAVLGDEPQEIRLLKGSFNELLGQVRLEQRRRRSFMATLVHDLKTPLIAIHNLLGVVRDDDDLRREERIRVVAQLSEENRALIHLVQKMVDAYKFEREDVALERRTEELRPLLEHVVARVLPLAEARGVQIDLRGEAVANVDPKEVERAFYNLVSNAVRYARSFIRIDLYAGVVRLTDDGPGLPAPLETLAQPFNAQPIDIAGQRYTAGTAGLGLFIARRILELHGGKLITEATGASGTVLLAYLGAP